MTAKSGAVIKHQYMFWGPLFDYPRNLTEWKWNEGISGKSCLFVCPDV